MEPIKKINVTFDVTLSKAREWYNSGNKTLKEIALKAFLENELKPHPYSEIKTFEDAVKALGKDIEHANFIVNVLEHQSKASAAMFKLSIVRKALNLGQDLSLTKCPKNSHFYYPHNPISVKSSTYFNLNKMEVIGKIKSEEEEYYVIGGRGYHNANYGLCDFYPKFGVGDTPANIGFLGCASEEIASHFGKYFGMLITEAKYGDLADFEIIEDKYGNA